ncbi:MAG: hypothetical protein WBL68_06150 [Nitrososphaeraceae archaeon]
MENNESNLTSNAKTGQERKALREELKQPGQWAQVVGQVME